MTREQFRFVEPLSAHPADTELQQIVFSGHYLPQMDEAVAAYWRALALPYRETMQSLDGELRLRGATLKFLGSAQGGDGIDIGVRCARIGRSSLQLAVAVFCAETLLASAELRYGFTATQSHAAKPMPPKLRELLPAFEAGQPMLDLRLGRWDTLGRDAQAIRTRVFVQEQQIPAELEWDAADAQAVHALACNRLGMALGTGRLLVHSSGVAKIGRMAVLRSMRGAHIGRALLDALVQCARGRGDREVLLHAQMSAAGFYTRAGFTARGAPFDEAGISHVEMARTL